MKQLADYAKYITAIGALVAMIYGGFSWYNSSMETTAREVVAPVELRLEKLEERLTLSELRALLQVALDEMYYFRKKSREYPDDVEIAEKLAEAEEEVKDLKERIKELENKTD